MTVCAIILLALLDEHDDLAERLASGDASAMRELFDRHHASLYTYIRSRGYSNDDAEDLVQHAFVQVWQHRASLRRGTSPKAYLYRIAVNRSLNDARRQARLQPVEFDIVAEDQSPFSAVADAEFARELDRAVARLPERRRQVFELCMLQHFTYREAADVLDVSTKTIENHMALALRDLRHELRHFRTNYEID